MLPFFELTEIMFVARLDTRRIEAPSSIRDEYSKHGTTGINTPKRCVSVTTSAIPSRPSSPSGDVPHPESVVTGSTVLVTFLATQTHKIKHYIKFLDFKHNSHLVTHNHFQAAALQKKNARNKRRSIIAAPPPTIAPPTPSIIEEDTIMTVVNSTPNGALAAPPTPSTPSGSGALAIPNTPSTPRQTGSLAMPGKHDDVVTR